MLKVNMLDLSGEYDIFRDKVREAVDEVLESQQFINGPAVKELEQALASRVGVTHGIAISSGTDALLCALMAIGIGAGDEVILPSFTFFATAGVVARLGATPVFVDVDEATFNIDPSLVEKAITSNTRAIIVVHLFGQCADMDAINRVAKAHGVKVVEDAAQAIDATYGDKKAGNLADVASLSFYPTKNLGGFGEGGLILTNDDALAEVARSLRNHGESSRYHHDRVGGNFRLDTMKAAILMVKLNHLNEFTQRRQANAAAYDMGLANSFVTPPKMMAKCSHVYHQYTIKTPRRDELQAHLSRQGVGSGIYYPVPLHLQACFASLGYGPGSLPVTERLVKEVLSLPCHPMLSEEDVNHVMASILSCDQACDDLDRLSTGCAEA